MEETRDATHSPPHHTARPVPGSVSLADWLHSAFGQTTASVPNIDVIRSDLLWKSKPGDCRLYLKSRPAPLEKENDSAHSGAAFVWLVLSDTDTHQVLPSMDDAQASSPV